MSKKQFKSLPESIVQTAARLEAIADRFVFPKLGIKAASFRILKMLSAKAMTAKTLREQIGGTASNFSQRLASLEKAGLVARCVDDRVRDRRMVIFGLTDAGKTQISALDERFSRPTAELHARFSEAEIAAHFAFFEKLNQILDASEKCLPKLFDEKM